MRNDTFYLDGVDARSAGIRLQAPIEFSEAVPVVEAQTIPGRNGDLIWETGSYENRSASASCFCLQRDVEKSISSAGRFLMGKHGYRRLETTDDPDHYWMARVENSPQIEMRMKILAPFEIDFDCKPQRFLKHGENEIIFSSRGTLENIYCQDALPLITVYGSGSGWLIVGDGVFQIKDIDRSITLDSETQNAYNSNGNQNGNIDFLAFPVLKSGINEISWSENINSIKIVPRWWEL